MLRNARLILGLWLGLSLVQFNPYSDSTFNARHVRVATGNILTGVRADVTCTWGTAFADTNYSVVVTVEDTTALGLGLQAERVRSKTASAVVVQVLNASLSTDSGTVHCYGVHD